MKVTKDQIIRKAIIYFASHDYEGVSLNGIAESLDITKGAIYHYFKSKDELFRDAVLLILDSMEQVMDDEALGSMGIKEVLGSFLVPGTVSNTYAELVGVDFMNNYKSLIYLLFTAIIKYPEVEEKVRNSYINITKAIEMLFEGAAHAGEIRADLDLNAAAYLIAAYIDGGMLFSAIGADGGDDTIHERVLELLFQLLTGKSGKEGGGK